MSDKLTSEKMNRNNYNNIRQSMSAIVILFKPSTTHIIWSNYKYCSDVTINFTNAQFFCHLCFIIFFQCDELHFFCCCDFCVATLRTVQFCYWLCSSFICKLCWRSCFTARNVKLFAGFGKNFDWISFYSVIFTITFWPVI